VAVHAIPGGSHLSEDMGLREGIWRPTAYVASDGVIEMIKVEEVW